MRDLRLPELFVEARQRAAMQMVLSVVALKLIVPARHPDMPACDAVAAAADERPDVFIFLFIGSNIRIAQYNIHDSAPAVPGPQRLYMPAIGTDPDLRALCVAYGIKLRPAPILQLPKILHRNPAHRNPSYANSFMS